MSLLASREVCRGATGVKTVYMIQPEDKKQGCKKAWIFLTPNFTLLTFIKGFYEEIDKDNHTKPMKYVSKMLKITVIFIILLQTFKDVDFLSHFYFMLNIFSQFAYNFKTNLSTTGAAVPWFYNPASGS